MAVLTGVLPLVALLAAAPAATPAEVPSDLQSAPDAVAEPSLPPVSLSEISAAEAAAVTPRPSVRLKDLGRFRGVRSNPLVGYGLVVGLAGTGDGKSARQSLQALAASLAAQGIVVSTRDLGSGNVAAVMVTAELPPFARSGQRLDVQIASIGDARSLGGGVLLRADLLGADGALYAIAQGAVVIGGFSEGGGGSSSKKNTPTSGSVPSGAAVEREAPTALPTRGPIHFDLHRADFSTATRVASALCEELGAGVAVASDAGSVQIAISAPAREEGGLVSMLARIESVRVAPDRIARVVVSERTGTIVAGSDVRIAPILVAHGSLVVEIKASNSVSQAAPHAKGGETVELQNVEVGAHETRGSVASIGGEATVEDLAASLNRLGVTPRDLIAILEAVSVAGALEATLEVR